MATPVLGTNRHVAVRVVDSPCAEGYLARFDESLVSGVYVLLRVMVAAAVVGVAMPAVAQDTDGGTGGGSQADALKQLEGFQAILVKEVQDAGSNARLKKCLEEQKKKVDSSVNSLGSPLPKWGVIYTIGFEAFQKSRACANTQTGESAEQLTVEEATDLAKNVPGVSTTGITPVAPLIPPAASPTM